MTVISRLRVGLRGSVSSRAAVAALLMVACSGAQEPLASAGSSAGGCAQARESRRQAGELYAAGKVDRAHRTLDAANRACAAEAASSWGLELDTLIELGLEREASALARQVSSSPEASAADAARARAWLTAPGKEQPASGEQLLAAGLAKKAAGDLASAQKLLDRARLALEAKAGSAMVLEPSRGLWNVSALSWSPDGNTLVLAVGGALHWFGTDGYRELSRQRTGSASITSIAFSPDGRSLALGVGEGGAVLWDVAAAREAGKLASDVPGLSRTLVFSPDGSLLAGRSWEDSRVAVWSVAARQALPPFQPIRGEVTLCGVRGGSNAPGSWPAMLAFSPDGASLLGTCAQRLAVWAIGSGQPGLVKALAGAEGDELYSVAYHPDGRHVVAATESGIVATWDVGTGRRLATLDAHDLNPLARFSRDGKRLVSAALDGAVRSFSFAGGVSKPIGSYRVPIPLADALAIHPDATKAALAGGGGLVVQDTVTGEVTQAVRAPLGLSALAIDAQMTRLAFGTHTGAVGLLDVASGALRWSNGHAERVTALAFSPDGASLASAARDTAARIWDVKSGQSRLVLAHAAPLNAVAYRGDGQVVVTAGDDGVVHVWDPASGKEARQLPGSSCAIAALSYSPDSSRLVANATDHALLRWDAKTYAPAESPAGAPKPAYTCGGELRASATSLAFSSDGALVASAPAGHSVELWGAQSGERRGDLTDLARDFHPTSVALSPRDPLAVAAGGARVRAWRLPEQAEVAISPPPEGADALLFSADGRFLFGATQRGAVAVWSVANGGAELNLAMTLALEDTESALALSADGLVQWLDPTATGSAPPSPRAGAACVLGSRLYPVELCEERFAAPGLVARVLSGK